MYMDGPGVIREREWWPGVGKFHKGGVGGTGSGLAGLHRKDRLTGELSAISRNELAPRGVVHPESARA